MATKTIEYLSNEHFHLIEEGQINLDDLETHPQGEKNPTQSMETQTLTHSQYPD